MSTLLTVHSPGKKHPRICSALCYNAKHPGCHCICEGKNHQKGLLQAAKNVEELLPNLISRFAGEGGVVKSYPVQVPMEIPVRITTDSTVSSPDSVLDIKHTEVGQKEAVGRYPLQV